MRRRLLIHDSHLRAEEVAAEGSFGHAAAEYAVRLGELAGARRVALFHHRPERTDAEVERTVGRFAERGLLGRRGRGRYDGRTVSAST